MAAVIFSTKAAFKLLCTYTRSAQLQICPVLPTREAKIDCTAKSKSASFSTNAGALPPNSNDTLVILSEAAAITCRPASTEPVKLTIATCGCLAKALPISAPAPFTTLNTPAGKPTLCTISAKIWQLIGVMLLGLITIVLPVTNAGPILRAIKKKGKFHGKMPAITPKGRLNKKIFSRARSL